MTEDLSVIGAWRGASGSAARVWYVSYGSNMHLDRLTYYIAGGRPPGTAATYPGCRDRRPPQASVPVELRGCMYFATESVVWTGGRAFYDPAGRRRVPARAHLVTAEQFSDIAAQEMYRAPGADLDLTEVLERGRSVLGPGRYETLLCPGSVDGSPALTFTAPWSVHDVAWNKPSAAYVRHLAAGLVEAGAWDVADIAVYLASCPGAAGEWSPQDIADLIADPSAH
ncbi:histone deacetylase [Streptomyces sp. NBC_00370]|uniref:histone deacetylase n=1 Tax=Streptomyces sp. NBC_00370 TaxID=2975728 RepID=UPI002E25E132